MSEDTLLTAYCSSCLQPEAEHLLQYIAVLTSALVHCILGQGDCSCSPPSYSLQGDIFRARDGSLPDALRHVKTPVAAVMFLLQYIVDTYVPLLQTTAATVYASVSSGFNAAYGSSMDSTLLVLSSFE